jgi:hypothetical protein
MNSKNESLEESKNQEINYFRVIWGWKWAVILIPLIAMITAKLTEQPIPEIYETKAGIVISGQGSRKPLSKSSFESIAFLPVALQKTIDQLSLKMADGTSMNQTTLKNQLKTEIPGNPVAPVAPGFLFFIVRNENPDLAKKIADLWVRFVEKEAKKIEAFNLTSLSPQKKIYQQRMRDIKFTAELKLTEKKSELSTYKKRLKTFSNSKVQFFPGTREPSTIIQHDHSTLKKESSTSSIQTTLHSALKGLILNKELEIEALDNKIHFLNTNISANIKHKFVSSIASIIDAPVIKTPITREKYTHIFLAGIISFGFILLACVLKAHIDVMRQE